MTPREDDLIDAWAEMADAEIERDREHAARCWRRILELQGDVPEQRTADCE